MIQMGKRWVKTSPGSNASHSCINMFKTALKHVYRLVVIVYRVFGIVPTRFEPLKYQFKGHFFKGVQFLVRNFRKMAKNVDFWRFFGDFPAIFRQNLENFEVCAKTRKQTRFTCAWGALCDTPHCGKLSGLFRPSKLLNRKMC